MRTVRSPERDAARAPTLLAKQGFLPALLGPVYCAGILGDANHWGEASE